MAPTTKTELLSQAAAGYKAFHEALVGLNAARSAPPSKRTAKRGAAVADVLLKLDRSHEYFMRAVAGVPGERFQPGDARGALSRDERYFCPLR